MKILTYATDDQLEMLVTQDFGIKELKAARDDLRARIKSGKTIEDISKDDGLCLNGICKPLDKKPQVKKQAVIPSKLSSEEIDSLHLLTKDFYTKQQVVEDAKKRSPNKKFAMVIVKSHFCDQAEKHCLMATQGLIDPYNTFVQENF